MKKKRLVFRLLLMIGFVLLYVSSPFLLYSYQFCGDQKMFRMNRITGTTWQYTVGGWRAGEKPGSGCREEPFDQIIIDPPWPVEPDLGKHTP